MLIAQLEEDSTILTDISATLITDESFDDVLGAGGIATEEYNISLYGNAQGIYRLSQPVIILKSTELRFELETMEKTDHSEICLYENEEDLKGAPLLGSEYRCVDFTLSSTGKIENIGDLFDYRTTSIQYIVFRQFNSDYRRSGEITISNIIFTADPDDQQDIQCSELDPNALKLDNNSGIGGIQCKCREGYVASNGGKVLNKQDSCVACFGTCLFDGHACNYDRDCASGWCDDNMCKSTVSILKKVFCILQENTNK